MQVISTNFTVAEYTSQMQTGTIKVNRDYQRTDKVWPQTAKSFLLDTMLLGYPLPKLYLYQVTDIKSRSTVKEIVDGQQRSQAISEYLNDEFAIAGKNTEAGTGKKFSQLDQDLQGTLLNYSLSADLFVGATPENIRETFRRMNSYTVPLNPQEKRHAMFQGDFKWFIVAMCQQYADTLMQIGVFSEKQLSRMTDAVMFSEVVYFCKDGIIGNSEPKLNNFYRTHEESSGLSEEMKGLFRRAFDHIAEWKDVHNTDLMKPFLFQSMLTAVIHHLKPQPGLQEVFPVHTPFSFNNTLIASNLGVLNYCLEDRAVEKSDRFKSFIEASSQGTNTPKNRQERFLWLCRAMSENFLK